MDVLVVGLGSTAGLRLAEDELAASLRRAGASVQLARAEPPRPVRTFALTDLAWALAARRAALRALRAREGDSPPLSLLYAQTTAALLWPRPGAIRFDELAARNRPGRHGLWQRPLEAHRLAQAPVLVPQTPGLLPPGLPGREVVVPIPVREGDSPPVSRPRPVAAVTYAANPHKKGLDRVLAAWAAVARDGEELHVVGAEPGQVDGSVRGVVDRSRLAPDAMRALLRSARVYVTAPRQEDFGIVQLEALADGCVLVTSPAPGPYAALPIARRLDPALVADDLAPALRRALDLGDAARADYAARAAELLRPFSREAVDEVVRSELLPALRACASP